MACLAVPTSVNEGEQGSLVAATWVDWPASLHVRLEVLREGVRWAVRFWRSGGAWLSSCGRASNQLRRPCTITLGDRLFVCKVGRALQGEESMV